jgi:hypothetical protein
LRITRSLSAVSCSKPTITEDFFFRGIGAQGGG